MKKKLRGALCLFLTLVFTTGLYGCASYDNFKNAFFGEKTEQEETIKIAVYEPMTGQDSKGAQAEIRGIELAHELYDICLDKRVELIYADNRSDITAAQEAVSELIAKNPAVVLGSYGSVYSLAASQMLEDAKIPAISATNSNPIVTNANPFYSSVNFMDTFDGVAMAKYAVEQMHCPQLVTIAAYNDDYGDALAKSFAEKAMQLSENIGIIKNTLTYQKNSDDYSELVEQLAKENVYGAFLVASPSDAVKIISQMRENGISTVFLGTTAWDTENFVEQFPESVRSSLGGVLFTSDFDSDVANTARTKEFYDAYCEKYDVDTPPNGAALGFDAYCLAIDAMQRAGTYSDGAAINAQLLSTREFMGASGNISLDKKGEPIKSVAIKRIYQGEVEAYTSIEPKWGN